MKSTLSSLGSIAIAFFTLISTSCHQDEVDSSVVGQAEISFSISEALNSGGRVNAANPRTILVTIADQHGNFQYQHEKVELFKFGNDYISKPLSFKPGSFKLTEFIVLDENDNAIYATPAENSKLTYLVEHPLPLSFNIEKDRTLKLQPQVIAADVAPAADFGYSTFTFNVVKTFSFALGVFAYSSANNNFELTTSHLLIKGDNGVTYYNGDLSAVTSTINIKEGSPAYTLTITKQGYETVVKHLTQTELKAFNNDSSLVITLNQSTANGALSFDGINDYVDLRNIYDDLNLPVTISAWVYIDANAPFTVLFSSQENSSVYNGFTFGASSTHVAIGYGDGLGENNGAFRRGMGADVSSFAGKWTYIAGVMRSGTDMTLYVNGTKLTGIPEGSSNNTMASNYPNDIAKIGMFESNGFTYRFAGKLDELKIWKRALSDQEIADNMTKRLTGAETGLIGYWSFDEQSGTAILDKSNNHFNGNLINNPARVASGIPDLHD